MATIIGGIGTSYVPTIAVTYDKGRHTEPAWAPLFEGYEPVAKWRAEHKPDVLLVFYNDHANSFFFDVYPTFALGIGERFVARDARCARRAHPPAASHLLPRHVDGDGGRAVRAVAGTVDAGGAR